MGTRGVVGFHKKGVDKIAYQQYDSYPEGIGSDVVEFVRNTSIFAMHQIFDGIEVVSNEVKPTPEQIAHCEPWTDLGVSEQSTADWYCLTRDAQGNLEVYKAGLRYMLDAADFLKNSLYCEWGYIINLDENVLEIYQGFQSSPQDNRYVTYEPYNGVNYEPYNGVNADYYNCALIAKFPLNNVPVGWIEQVKGDDD